MITAFINWNRHEIEIQMGVNDTFILLSRVSIVQVDDETVRVTRVCVVRSLQLPPIFCTVQY